MRFTPILSEIRQFWCEMEKPRAVQIGMLLNVFIIFYRTILSCYDRHSILLTYTANFFDCVNLVEPSSTHTVSVCILYDIDKTEEYCNIVPS